MYITPEHVMNNTKFKKWKTAKAAIETLLWLENGAQETKEKPLSFNMNRFLFHKGMHKGCGTICCIAGAITQFEKRRVGGNSLFYEFKEGINLPLELYHLFYAPGLAKHLGDVKPEEAAITLRRYLETGVVSWDHVNAAMIGLA